MNEYGYHKTMGKKLKNKSKSAAREKLKKKLEALFGKIKVVSSTDLKVYASSQTFD